VSVGPVAPGAAFSRAAGPFHRRRDVLHLSNKEGTSVINMYLMTGIHHSGFGDAHQIRKIGNSDGFILPRELMLRLDLKRGQFLHLIEIPGGGFQLIPYDPDLKKP